MPLIVTPRQLDHRGQFYHQLAGLIAAGIGIIQGLELIRKGPPDRSFRKPLAQLIDALNQGYRFSEALRLLRRWLPAFDISLIQAGEQSGRLDASLRSLAGYYHERAQLARSMISDSAYTVFAVHFAILIFPTSQLRQLVWEGDVLGFLWAKITVFLPIYTVLWLFLYAAQSWRSEPWRARVEQVAGWIPLLGSARRSVALARLASALEALINAGVSIISAWDLAAAVSGSPAIRRAVSAGKTRVLNGETPGEVIQDSRVFPELFANMYRTGELSGKLDQTLAHLHQHYQEEGSRKLKAVAEWLPRGVYLGLAALIGYQIVSFWMGYFQERLQPPGF